MLKRSFAALLVALLTVASFGLRGASAQAAMYTSEQARAAVSRVGVGEKARVEVRLRDKSKLKGYVSEAGPDSFTVTDKTGAARAVSYADVAQVKRRGGGLSGGTKAMIWGGVAVGAVVTLFAVRGAFCDGMC